MALCTMADPLVILATVWIKQRILTTPNYWLYIVVWLLWKGCSFLTGWSRGWRKSAMFQEFSLSDFNHLYIVQNSQLLSKRQWTYGLSYRLLIISYVSYFLAPRPHLLVFINGHRTISLLFFNRNLDFSLDWLISTIYRYHQFQL